METRIKFTWPDKTALSKNGFAIVRKLRKAGFAAYIAGGSVRDALLKRKIEEVDIATSATPAQVKKLFTKTIDTGEKHGTVTVRIAKTNYEVTTFRTESVYQDRRRPSKVKFIKDPETDAQRRDFTINAFFYDPSKKKVIDFVDGLPDLKAQKIRVVGSEDRILEDALRILRAVRFATILQFDLTHDTLRAIRKHGELLQAISAERIKQELDKIMLSRRAAIGIGIMDAVGILQHILPEVHGLQGVTQPRKQHAEGDVYTHSLLALENVDESYDLPTRYATFFHDLGKKETRQVRQGKITFYDHQNVGAKLAGQICQRLKFSNQEIQKITWLVAHHMVPNDFAHMKLSTRRKWGLAEHFADLLKVFLADARASLKPGGRSETRPGAYKEGLKILEEIKTHPALRKPLISGKDVMNTLKIDEGPMVGKVLRLVEDLKLGNKITTKKAALAYLRKNKKELARE